MSRIKNVDSWLMKKEKKKEISITEHRKKKKKKVVSWNRLTCFLAFLISSSSKVLAVQPSTIIPPSSKGLDFSF